MENDLIYQIKRFQKLKEYVGASKISSFSVEIFFYSDEEQVDLVLGTYDCGSMSRATKIETSFNDLVEDLQKKVDECYKECGISEET